MKRKRQEGAYNRDRQKHRTDRDRKECGTGQAVSFNHAETERRLEQGEAKHRKETATSAGKSIEQADQEDEYRSRTCKSIDRDRKET